MTNGPVVVHCKLERDGGKLPVGKGLVAVAIGYLPMVKHLLGKAPSG